jgi:hypothetical protein
MQYRQAPYNPAPHPDMDVNQLLTDDNFLSGTDPRQDGRNYGLVAVDTGYDPHVILISGTTSQTLYTDMIKNTMCEPKGPDKACADKYGQLERHVNIYHRKGAIVSSRYYSFTDSDHQEAIYEGRVAYPNNPFVRRGQHLPSRLAYNVYERGHWYLHITQPGNLTDLHKLEDQYLWDIRDIDNDGQDEWFISPARYTTDPDVPGYYHVKWKTSVYRWNESSLSLTQIQSYDGVIPHFINRFREAERTTSMSYLYPVLTASYNGALWIVMATSAPTDSLRLCTLQSAICLKP